MFCAHEYEGENNGDVSHSGILSFIDDYFQSSHEVKFFICRNPIQYTKYHYTDNE